MTTLEPGTVIAGRYQLDRPLARGGMGAVWVGRHLQLDARIAVKLMDPGYASSAEARGRFEREAKACARLDSPHIIKVHDYGVEGSVPYIVMELLDGEDLGVRLKRAQRLPLSVTAALVLQIGKGLRAAHEAGIVHRDLKPGNIFLCSHQGEDVVKILDFGIAKSLGEAQVGEGTATGMLLGSPHFMSPEQARALKDVDHRSDLWSLGVILFRCVTGRLPFPGQQISDVLVAICVDPIPLPSQLAPDLGREVDGFFARALARDPAQRFQSARELAEAFAALAAGEASRQRFSLASAPSIEGASTSARSVVAVTTDPRLTSASQTRQARVGLTVLAAMTALLAVSALALLLRHRPVELAAAGAEAASASSSATAAPTAPPAAPRPEPTASATASSAAPATVTSARVPSAKGALPALPVVKKSESKKDPTFGF